MFWALGFYCFYENFRTVTGCWMAMAGLFFLARLDNPKEFTRKDMLDFAHDVAANTAFAGKSDLDWEVVLEEHLEHKK